MHIIVCDPVSPKGVALLQQRKEFKVTVLEKRLPEAELLSVAHDAVALVVRSETKVTRKVIENCPQLRVVGRAGVGVDNVDVEAATQRGVVVMNTPGGNTLSTAELTFSMLMSLARNIPQAHMTMKAGKWDRKLFQGVELNNKTLGILGMGRIGSEVARRAIAFGMKVLAYDPYITLSRAKALQVELVEQLEDIYPRADFITVHMPMSDQTRGMLNAQAFAKMKKGVRIINCARGGIVHEADLQAAILAGQVAGAALDVYEAEPPPANFPLRDLPQVIMTPHLGASTEEAQENVGIEVAEAITDFLISGAVRNAVNLPNLDANTYALVKPYLNLGEKLGRLVAGLAPRRNERLVVTYGGKATAMPGDPITRSVLKGFLESRGQDVNTVNVRSLAAGMGLLVEEIKSNEETDFNEWIHVAVTSDGQRTSAGGTFFGAHNHPRIVRINSIPVEVTPAGVLFLMTNKDRPGIVGYLGTLMGRFNINIGNMSLCRDNKGGHALTVLNLDTLPPADLIAELQKDPDITDIHLVQL